jgi:hypothetical protein
MGTDHATDLVPDRGRREPVTRRGIARGLGWTIIVLLWLMTALLTLVCGACLANWVDTSGPLTLTLCVALAILLALLLWIPLVLGTALCAWPLRFLLPHQSRCLRWCRAAVLGSLLAACLHMLLLDGWPGTVRDLGSRLLHGDRTVCASGYSELGFMRVRSGMTWAQVIDEIGGPLTCEPEGFDSVVCRWTTIADGSPWGDRRVREVHFREGHGVVTRHSEFRLAGRVGVSLF